MIDLSLAVLAGASLCVFMGALIRGFTGFGFGISATPLLVLLFPPAEIVPAILIAGSSDGAPTEGVQSVIDKM